MEWEQRPNESPKSYRLFQEYLLQGETRSLSRVHTWAQLQGYAISLAGIRKLAQRHDWRRRARAFDGHLAQERFETHAETEQERLRRIRAIARLLIDKALQAWERLPAEQLTPREALWAARLGAQLQAGVAVAEHSRELPFGFDSKEAGLIADVVDLLVAEDEETREAIVDAIQRAIAPYTPIWMR